MNQAAQFFVQAVDRLVNDVGQITTCRCCDGLTVQDAFFGMFESDHRLAIWRCLHCGEILDPVIVANCRHQSAGVEPRAYSSDHEIQLGVLTTVA
jgi:hypothetical protein